MSRDLNPKIFASQPAVYEIRVQGHLDRQWITWFGEGSLRLEDNGDTVFTCRVADQAALHGVLKRIRDLGMPLLALNPVQEDAPMVKQSNSSKSRRTSMNMNVGPNAFEERRAKLSTLWIFAMLNYLYCDVLGLMDPEMLRQFLAGNVGSLHVTQAFLLQGAILMEIPAAMVLLARVLKYGPNRWTNIIAGVIMTLVQVGSLFVGSGPTMFYLFFSAIEIACTAFIAWYAWSWVGPAGSLKSQPD